MRLCPIFLCAISAHLAASLPAKAEAPGAPPTTSVAPDPGRFSMTPAEGGFLRLDKDTGAVSFCSVKDGLSQCRASADERVTLETEITRLRQENLDLKSRIGLAPNAPKAPSANSSDEEFERALSFTERFMRHMMRIFREEAPQQQGNKL